MGYIQAWRPYPDLKQTSLRVNMFLQTHLPLPTHQPPQTSPPEIPPSPSRPLCAESEPLGCNEIEREVNYVEALVGDTMERGDIR